MNVIPRPTTEPHAPKLLGHKDVKTTMIYTHFIQNSSVRGIVSPTDALGFPVSERISAIEHTSCDIADGAIEHPMESRVQSGYEPIDPRQKGPSMGKDKIAYHQEPVRIMWSEWILNQGPKVKSMLVSPNVLIPADGIRALRGSRPVKSNR